MRILAVNIALRKNPARICLPIGLECVISGVGRAGFGFDVVDREVHPDLPAPAGRLLRTHSDTLQIREASHSEKSCARPAPISP
jgi:hypothetical protein